MPSADESVHRLAASQLFENYKIADDLLAGREYFFDHFTAADAHFFWTFRRGASFDLDLSRFANCMAHFERMKSRPSVQKLLAYEKSVQAEFGQGSVEAEGMLFVTAYCTEPLRVSANLPLPTHDHLITCL